MRGNDHIHLAVNLVREDGTVADPGFDKWAMSQMCAELERRFGLSVVEGRATALGMPGYTRAEVRRAESEGRPEPDSLSLARHVRVAAGLASDEADFVQDRLAEVLGQRLVVSGGDPVRHVLTSEVLRSSWPPHAVTGHQQNTSTDRLARRVNA